MGIVRLYLLMFVCILYSETASAAVKCKTMFMDFTHRINVISTLHIITSFLKSHMFATVSNDIRWLGLWWTNPSSSLLCKVFLIFPGTSSPILIPHLAMPEADLTRGVICF